MEDKNIGQVATELDAQAVVEVYKAYLEDSQRIRDERLASTSLNVTIVTFFLGAQAFVAYNIFTGPQINSLASFSSYSWAPVIIAVAIGFVGFQYCRYWGNTNTTYKETLKTKYANLLELEESKQQIFSKVGVGLFIKEDAERKATKEAAERQKAAKAKKTKKPAREPAQKPRTAASIENLQNFFRLLFLVVSLGVLIAKVGFALYSEFYGPIH